MHLCVWTIFRAPRILAALASHVQPLGFLTLPTAQDHKSEPWGQQPLPQWPHSSRAGLQLPAALPCPATGPDLSPVSASSGLGLPPSLLAALLLAEAVGQSLDATSCLDTLKGVPVGPAPSPRALPTPELPCNIVHGLVVIIQHSTGKVTWHVPSEISERSQI